MLATPPSGAFVRWIDVLCGQGEARGVMLDDFHHFRVSLRHAAGRVVEAAGQALRYPWTTCGAAPEALQQLVGMELSESSIAVYRQTDSGGQCTHLFELAGLVLAVAAQGDQERRYRVEVADRDRNGLRRSRIFLGGAEILDWMVSDDRIASPAGYADRQLGAGFTQWVTAARPNEAEAALLLRRAIQISNGRLVDLDAMARPRRIVPCFTLSLARIDGARRMRGSARDFSAGAEPDRGSDEEWLRGALVDGC
ncbi:MAG: DUF2889 domain-containing protein [Phenylobacterium sp.]